MLDLPREVVIMVLGQLDLMRTISAVRCVCTSFEWLGTLYYTIIEQRFQAMRSISFTTYISTSTLFGVKRGPQYIIRISNYDGECCIRAILNKTRNVRHKVVYYSNESSMDKLLENEDNKVLYNKWCTVERKLSNWIKDKDRSIILIRCEVPKENALVL